MEVKETCHIFLKSFIATKGELKKNAFRKQWKVC